MKLPADPWPGLATTLLRAAVCGFCLGWALWLLGRLGTQTGAWLLFHAHLPHPSIGLGERTVGWIMIGLAALAWWPGRAVAWVGLAGLLAAVDAGFGAWQGGYAYAAWTPAAHGLRIAAPLALVVLALTDARGAGRWLGLWLLRVGAAAVFMAHGLEAMLGHAGFQDFLIGTIERFTGLIVAERQVQPLLIAIGVMDLAVAGLILSARPSRWLWWAAAWGAITAGARVTTYGWEVYGEILLRLPHVGVPLVLWRMTRRPRPPVDA